MTAQMPIAAGRAAGIGFVPALAALALAAAALQSLGPFNHDVAWILTGAERVLDGAVLGRDIIDPNPPLPWWLATIPVGLARAAGLAPAAAAIAFTIIACLASILLTRAALIRSGSPLAGSEGFQLFAAAVLLFAPGYDFGQREHFLLIGALPYLACVDAAVRGRWLSRGLALGIGAFAGLAFCQKPYFLLVPIAAELWAAARKRRIEIRPEALVLLAIGLLYAAAVLLWAPFYLSAALPETLASYWVFDSPPTTVAARLGFAFLPLAAAALLLRGGSGTGEAAEFLFVGALAGAAAAALQLKGWPYHLLPGVGLAAIGCAALFVANGARHSMAAAAALLLIAYSTFGATLSYARAAFGEADTAAQLGARFARADGPVFAFNPGPRDIHPAILAAGAEWPSPYCCLYTLPAWVRAGEAPERAPAARAAALRQLAIVLARLEARPPALIAVADGPFKLGFGARRFDYLAFLARFPGFRRLMADYAEEERIGDYRIFVRR